MDGRINQHSDTDAACDPFSTSHWSHCPLLARLSGDYPSGSAIASTPDYDYS